MFKHRITVFTPTYNRAHTLQRLYQSLQRQTFTDFEWLVIDDGSSDSTEVLVSPWLNEINHFTTRYFKKENAGKIAAINDGLDLAQGELFFIVDSDDFITEDALQKIHHWVSELPKNTKFCGIMGNKGVALHETPNNFFEEEYIDTDFLEITSNKVIITGERAHVFFTEIHKQYKYPIFAGEKFMTEAVAKNRMARDGFKIRAFNDIIYIYEYQDEGLTNNITSAYINSPKGYALWMKERAEFLNLDIITKFKLYYSYYAAVRQKINLSEIKNNLQISDFVLWIIVKLFKFKSIVNKLS